MKTSFLALGAVLILAISGSAFIVLSSSGIAGRTGSPGESSCASCHGGGSSAATDVSVSAIPSFTNNEFVPGTTYTLGVTVSAAGFSKFGFGCEILNELNGNSGLMQLAGTGVKFLNSGVRKNAVHTTAKSGIGSATFNFQWVAPSIDTIANIYVCGNAVNGNNSDTGDLPILMSPLQLKAATPAIDTNHYAPVREFALQVNKIEVSPNPARDLVRVSYSLNDKQEIEIQLTEISGKLVKSLSAETQVQGLYSKTLSLEGLSGGAYFIKVLGNNRLRAQKMLLVQ